MEQQAYKKGDFIGQKYEVVDVLGEGGFGIVYLVYSHETKSVYALKTFRDEYLKKEQTRIRFQNEAQIWVDLELHPYLVRAYFVDEISGRLFIALEYIVSDEQGLNSLDKYLNRKPPDLTQSLRWAIQFCYGMEYAYSKGIRAHRDIKPTNIMIDQNKTVKISDFGLAGIFQHVTAIPEQRQTPRIIKGDILIQTAVGTSMGTPEYMSPEQFTDFSLCNEKSDIYSFGVVVYQMVSGGKLPFYAGNPDYRWNILKQLHHYTQVPKLDSPLCPIILKCLEKEPQNRYGSFQELRIDFESILKQLSGEIFRIPEPSQFGAWDWSNKGNSLSRLGRSKEALVCFDKALQINRRDAFIWSNKGAALSRLGRHTEAIQCCDEALSLNARDVLIWYTKGSSLLKLGRFDEAVRCYDRALELGIQDEKLIIIIWKIKGSILIESGHVREAIFCFDKALGIDLNDIQTWLEKAIIEDEFELKNDAIYSYRMFLKLASDTDYASEISKISLRVQELEHIKPV